jgi:hypothetical protein
MNCPYCRTELDAPDAGPQKICEGCGTPHHEECFAENGGCTLFGCKFAPADEPKIRLQAAEIPLSMPMTGVPGANSPGNASIAYTGFGDTMAQSAVWMRQAVPAPAPQRTATPPPPPATSNVAAPPAIPVLSGTMLSPLPMRTAAAPAVAAVQSVPSATQPAVSQSPAMARGIFNPGDERQPKSRMTYIMLGIFLGIFGAHSFYAGYWKRGLLQVGLTLLSFFYASPITAVWAIAEVCSVDRDIHDVEFS